MTIHDQSRLTVTRTDLGDPSTHASATGRAYLGLGAPQLSQLRDWRHRGMGKGLVSERDLNPHVCDLRRYLPRPCREAHNHQVDHRGAVVGVAAGRHPTDSTPTTGRDGGSATRSDATAVTSDKTSRIANLEGSLKS
jgi:hypothetical protein